MLRRKKKFMIMAIGLSALFAMSCQKSSQESATAETATADTSSVASTDSVSAQNTLPREEKAAGWELLFDGTTLNGWAKMLEPRFHWSIVERRQWLHKMRWSRSDGRHRENRWFLDNHQAL